MLIRPKDNLSVLPLRWRDGRKHSNLLGLWKDLQKRILLNFLLLCSWNPNLNKIVFLSSLDTSVKLWSFRTFNKFATPSGILMSRRRRVLKTKFRKDLFWSCHKLGASCTIRMLASWLSRLKILAQFYIIWLFATLPIARIKTCQRTTFCMFCNKSHSFWQDFIIAFVTLRCIATGWKWSMGTTRLSELAQEVTTCT